MIFAVFIFPILGLSLNTYVRSVSLKSRSMLILREMPINLSMIHYQPYFYSEVFPAKGYKAFGGYFPYGGVVKFDKPVSNSSYYIVSVPAECRDLYVSTLPYDRFRIGASPSNVRMKKDQMLCYFHMGHPSRVDVNMSIAASSRLEVKATDNRYDNSHYLVSENNSFIVNSSVLLYWHTKYFFENNFVNVTVHQMTNTIPLPSHAANIRIYGSASKNMAVLLQEPIDTHSGDTDDVIFPTYQVTKTSARTTYGPYTDDDKDDDVSPTYQKSKTPAKTTYGPYTDDDKDDDVSPTYQKSKTPARTTYSPYTDDSKDDGVSPRTKTPARTTNNHYTDDDDEGWKPSYNFNGDEDSDDFLNDSMVEMIVLSVFAVCLAILIGCCGACCYCCCCRNKHQNNDENGMELEDDLEDAIPPTVPAGTRQQQVYQYPAYYQQSAQQPQVFQQQPQQMFPLQPQPVFQQQQQQQQQQQPVFQQQQQQPVFQQQQPAMLPQYQLRMAQQIRTPLISPHHD